MTSATPIEEADSTATRSRLRKDRATRACSSASTTSTEPPADHSAMSDQAAFVEGVSNPPGSRTATVSRSAWTDRALRSAARRSLRLTLKV